MNNKRFFNICLVIPSILFFGLLSCSNKQSEQKITFGICTDVHKDIMHDADERLISFVNEMNQRQVDFTIQLGDFCRPYEYNDTFMNIWNSFDGPKYSVLGNHDMDGGFSRDETLSYFDMPAKYYSFNIKGFHFIVLDGNDKSETPQEGYARYIGIEQENWLKNDLLSTDYSCIIFLHQSLEDEWGIENAAEIRSILENENLKSGKDKVIACFNGHSHMDTAININDIWYVEVNSMSYFWVGEKYMHNSYIDLLEESFPWLKYTCPYEEPLYAVVTIDSKGKISIEGKKTNWVGPSPAEIGYSYEKYMDRIKPEITNMLLK